jgi:hypothetical protein
MPATLSAQRGPADSSQVVVISATPDLTGGTLAVKGVNFGRRPPAITVDGVPVVATSGNDTELTVPLPRTCWRRWQLPASVARTPNGG